MGNRRLPAWFFGGKLTFAAKFTLGLSVLLVTGLGLFWTRTRPVLVWSDWGGLGIRDFGVIDCPKRLQAGETALVCLDDNLPEPFALPNEVILVTTGQEPSELKNDLPRGQRIAFEAWFSPNPSSPRRWCRQVQSVDFLSQGARYNAPVLLVVTVTVKLTMQESQQVLASCSVLLEDPRSRIALLFRFGAPLLALVNLSLTGWLWISAYRSYQTPLRKGWKTLLFLAGVVTLIALVILAIIGPVNWDTGSLFFAGERQVEQADHRMDGLVLLLAGFGLGAVTWLMRRRGVYRFADRL
jgi:hypothetical protein